MANFKSDEATQLADNTARLLLDPQVAGGVCRCYTGTFTVPTGGLAVGDAVELFTLPKGFRPLMIAWLGDNLADTAQTVVSIGTPADAVRYWSARSLGALGAGAAVISTVNLPTGIAGSGTEKFPVTLASATMLQLSVATNVWIAAKKLVVIIAGIQN